jgi:hypothetical protein
MLEEISALPINDIAYALLLLRLQQNTLAVIFHPGSKFRQPVGDFHREFNELGN